MIQTVFLDIDNTLMDFNANARESMEAAFREAGLSFREEMFPVFMAVNDRLWLDIEKGTLTREKLHRIRWGEVFRELDIDFDGEEFEHLFLPQLEVAPPLVEGALELLEYLYPKYTVCLASNAPYLQQTRRLAGSGILPYVHKVFISEKLGHAKPGKEFFDACFGELPGHQPEKSIMIGDSLSADIIGGKRYGMKTCWFNPENRTVPPELQIDYVVKSLKEIQKIL